MIEEANRLESYLPLEFGTTKERDYIRFLWDAFEANTENGKYQFAFLAYHMLIMCFIYFNIWQIKRICPELFETALIGFGKEVEKNFTDATSPFVFSTLNERTVLRFLKLIQCDNSKIGTYAKLVDDRNQTAHANGNIFFSSEAELTAKVIDGLRSVEEIQTQSRSIILDAYKAFLLSSQNPDERELESDDDQIREVLVKRHYMSASDIDFCRAFDIATLHGQPGLAAMKALHDRVAQLYPADE